MYTCSMKKLKLCVLSGLMLGALGIIRADEVDEFLAQANTSTEGVLATLNQEKIEQYKKNITSEVRNKKIVGGSIFVGIPVAVGAGLIYCYDIRGVRTKYVNPRVRNLLKIPGNQPVVLTKEGTGEILKTLEKRLEALEGNTTAIRAEQLLQNEAMQNASEPLKMARENRETSVVLRDTTAALSSLMGSVINKKQAEETKKQPTVGNDVVNIPKTSDNGIANDTEDEGGSDGKGKEKAEDVLEKKEDLDIRPPKGWAPTEEQLCKYVQDYQSARFQALAARQSYLHIVVEASVAGVCVSLFGMTNMWTELLRKGKGLLGSVYAYADNCFVVPSLSDMIQDSQGSDKTKKRIDVSNAFERLAENAQSVSGQAGDSEENRIMAQGLFIGHYSKMVGELEKLCGAIRFIKENNKNDKDKCQNLELVETSLRRVTVQSNRELSKLLEPGADVSKLYTQVLFYKLQTEKLIKSALTFAD